MIYHISGLTFRYNDSFLLDIEELAIERGSSLGLVGPNGCGKSTLLKILAFLMEPDEGVIYYDGKRIDGKSSTMKKDVTILLQEPYLLKRTVFENVAYGLKVRGEKRNVAQLVHGALEAVGLPPGKFAGRNWFELSGGEAQRVALASRLILNPRVLILDEPTASVDQESAALITGAIAAARRDHGTTLIVASHDLLWLNGVTDAVERIHRGRMAGHEMGNIISGPWCCHSDGLWKKTLAGGETISAVTPPGPDASAMLNPSDIMLSTDRPEGISAQNILQGVITQLAVENGSGRVLVTVDVAGFPLVARVTEKAVRNLHLLPGIPIWVLFKASSITWY